MADPTPPTAPLPVGTVTFLRTDVEGSMRLALALGSGWDAINGAHLGLLRAAVERHGGVCVRTEGDAMFAAFQEAGAGVRAAIEGQHAIRGQAWPSGVDVRVRMGVHTGEAHLAGDDYGGFEVNRAARIAAVGHGGQVVVSATTGTLVGSTLPPGVRLRDLGRHALKDIPAPEQLFQLDVPGLPGAFPPLRLVHSADGNLPDRLTTFVGRAAELAELEVLLDGHRLITLTGPGGIGKTSLAIELARSRAPTLRDGAWLVPLDGVTDPGTVTSVIARTLGLFDGVDRPAADALPTFLAGRSMLLLLDNFEHLLEAAGAVATLVRLAPGSRLVVTSRAPLHLSGEQEYPVRPLATGGGAADAPGTDLDASTSLFVDRARAVRPDWEPGPDLPVVVEICALLDGLPLGIELAAARLSLLPPAAIRDRLAARLPLPGSGPRDGPARQRTLEGAIDWSYDLLTPDERSTLHALAVFEGGFDVAQAELVIEDVGAPSGDALDRLLALGEHSLIARDQTPIGDAGRLAGSGIRFDMLRTVQGYALRHLVADGREAEVRRRHAQAYLELAETAARHLFTAGQPAWIDRLTLDQPNQRAALRWTIDSGETELALRLVAASWRFWQVVGQLAEGSTWAEAALSMPGADAPTPGRLGALAAAGGIAYWRSERDLALQRYREQLALAEQLSDAPATADAWFNLAHVTYVAGAVAEATRANEEARRRFVELGDERGVNRADLATTTMLMDTAGPEAMLKPLWAILERAVAFDDPAYVVISGGSLAWAHFMLGEFNVAARWGLQSMLASYGMRDVAGSTIALPIAAIFAIEFGLTEEAAFIMGAFEGLCERYGVRPPLGLEQMIRRTDPGDRLKALLEPEALAGALDRGRRMTIDEAMDLVVRIGDAIPSGEARSDDADRRPRG
jgi:predicted ATPase/class 3 adenylate cyclase